ncbi:MULTISPECIES: Ger(x)C family spore germination protein [Bacillaceae]|uniref:Ger(x)C family spore germination protein n=1 Tax=Bacillaceae TaxID=186817 RepID=UPI0010539A19|nr:MULTISPECIES: Ger(x)C family spore germination protein [Bacillaceae]MBY6024237.1 Ger(x)C family spore germination protein [Nitratireductor sp. DP7N14-4]MDT2048266.1 Ger(x)C family spore germination protein [Priestia flexa]TDB48633.1 Ger(x)C family spore germination protein [Bacillus sp. CBEL-1]
MKKQWKMWVLLSSTLALLTGCWDQKMLKDTIFMSAASYQIAPDGRIDGAIAVHSYISNQEAPVSKIYHATASSPRSGRVQLNEQLSGTLMTAKNRVFLIEDDLAKKGIIQLSDVLYRTPESPLIARYVIIDGKPNEIINMKQVGEELIGEYLSGVILTAEKQSLVPVETLQTICTLLFDEGKGLALPYAKFNKENMSVEIKGIALFNGEKFSGITLKDEEAKALLLLSNKKNKYMTMTDKVKMNGKEYIVSYDVAKAKSKLKIKVRSNHQLEVKVPVSLKVSITEFTYGEVGSDDLIKKIENTINKNVQNKAEKVVEKLQKANCDFLEVGRELMAYHPDVWKELEWKKDYAQIDIKPDVTVEVIHRGIIN